MQISTASFRISEIYNSDDPKDVIRFGLQIEVLIEGLLSHCSDMNQEITRWVEVYSKTYPRNANRYDSYNDQISEATEIVTAKLTKLFSD